MVRSDFYNNIITDETIDMMLRQIDAESIISKTGQIGRVRFSLSKEDPDLYAEYMYEITEDGELNMQRIEPISRNFGRLHDISNMVKEITYDLRNYKHAIDGGLFEKYVDIAGRMRIIRREFEDLFLMCDPNEESLEEVRKQVDGLLQSLKETFR